MTQHSLKLAEFIGNLAVTVAIVVFLLALTGLAINAAAAPTTAIEVQSALHD